MLGNCMTYNHADTIYHKEAQRLLAIGLKQLSKVSVPSSLISKRVKLLTQFKYIKYITTP